MKEKQVKEIIAFCKERIAALDEPDAARRLKPGADLEAMKAQYQERIDGLTPYADLLETTSKE